MKGNSTEPNVIALDIGGANLKASDGREFHASQFFPLWKNPEGLAEAIRRLLADAPSADRYVATMTGELADCFRTKREGVAAICDAAAAVCGPRLEIYLTDGTFVAPAEAKRRHLEAAASNWHATAALVARRQPSAAGVLIDCGSTTTDIIPFARGRVRSVGRTDTERLASGELVYTGVVRSPVCALVTQLPFGTQSAGVAQELFATTLDAYLLTGDLPADVDNRETADGRPATLEFAVERMARAICADRETFGLEAARRAATAVKRSQSGLIRNALQRVSDRQIPPWEVAYVCGQGEFLARDVLAGRHARVCSFAEEFGATASRVGPAFALARLAVENANDEFRTPRRIVKIGGSLFDRANWFDDVACWLAAQAPATTLLVCGGGEAIDEIARLQACECISDAEAHWRCIDVMRDNARLLTERIPDWRSFSHWDELNDERSSGRILVLDPAWFMSEVDARRGSGALPQSWDVSSDSIAARAAELFAADELVLLKSTLPSDLQRLGDYVDRYFFEAAGKVPAIRFVNLRDPKFPEVRWR